MQPDVILSLLPSTSIDLNKDEIKEKRGIATARQHLICNGSEMDGSSVKDQKIYKDCDLTMVLGLLTANKVSLRNFLAVLSEHVE